MLNKPTNCTPMGNYECQVPMPIGGKVRGIDYCIADIVAALNAAGIKTDMSCCGHGKMVAAVVMLVDGRRLWVDGHTPNGLEFIGERDCHTCLHNEVGICTAYVGEDECPRWEAT